ncbi:hypothetical protein MMC34_005670 [Xylographa carneopallida]|nr:hypothetical protein [Xylographa carneopallida]
MLGREEIDGLRLQLEDFRQSDQRKLDVIQRLLEEYQELSGKFKNLEIDLEVQTSARREMQLKARALDHKPFVLVLVNGDNYVFNDELLKAGTEGGVEAAGLLRDAVQADLKSLDDGISTRPLCGFGSSWTSEIGDRSEQVRGGFTRGQPLFDFVDAGVEKEGADHKIRELFDLLVQSNQCKHIIFGGCHDQGYLSLLTPHKKVDSCITLLKATTCNKKFRALGYRATEFPAVFKSVHLPENSNSGIDQSAHGAHVYDVQNGIIQPQLSANPQVSGHLVPEGTRRRLEQVIYLNTDSQRVDTPILGITEQGRARFWHRTSHQHLCNEYHLLGRCPALPGRPCMYDHGYVDPELILVLKERLRAQKCKTGGLCRSFDCYYGHVCRRHGCTGGKGCSFSSLLHNVDQGVISAIREGRT